MSLNFDVVIKNGKIVDGTGNLAFNADVGIKSGRIAAIEQDIPSQAAERLIDAAGCAVSPGFIDTHTTMISWFWSGLLPKRKCGKVLPPWYWETAVLVWPPWVKKKNGLSFIGIECNEHYNRRT